MSPEDSELATADVDTLPEHERSPALNQFESVREQILYQSVDGLMGHLKVLCWTPGLMGDGRGGGDGWTVMTVVWTSARAVINHRLLY